jgi:hypothetical protein
MGSSPGGSLPLQPPKNLKELAQIYRGGSLGPSSLQDAVAYVEVYAKLAS